MARKTVRGELPAGKRLITAEITAKPEIKERTLKDGDLAHLHDFIRSLDHSTRKPATTG